MPTQLSKPHWKLYNDPGARRVSQPLSPNGLHCLHIPIGRVGGTPFTMFLEDFEAPAQAATQSGRLLLKPQFAGANGGMHASVALRANGISPEGIPAMALCVEISWNRATATRFARIVRGMGSAGQVMGEAVELTTGAFEDVVDLALYVNDAGDGNVHVQVNQGNTVLFNWLDQGSPLYGVRGVWGASFWSDGGGHDDVLLIDGFVGSNNAPTENVPGAEQTILWADDFSPGVPQVNAPDIGSNYLGDSGALEAYFTENGEVVGNSMTRKYVMSTFAKPIPAGGYRIGFKVGRKGEDVFQQFGFCHNNETGVSYTLICLSSYWMIVKMVLVDNVLTPQTLTAANATWPREEGTPVDIVVKPGMGFDLFIDGGLAQSYSDTDYLTHTGIYFALDFGNAWKSILVTDDLTIQSPQTNKVWLYTDWTPDTPVGLPMPEIGNAWAPYGDDLSGYSTLDGKALSTTGGPPALNHSLPLAEVPAGGYRIYGKAGPGGFRAVYPCVDTVNGNGYQFVMYHDLGLQLLKLTANVPEGAPLAQNNAVRALEGCPWDIVVKPGVGIFVYVNGLLELTSTDTEYVSSASVVGWNAATDAGFAAPFGITANLTHQQGLEGLTEPIGDAQ